MAGLQFSNGKRSFMRSYRLEMLMKNREHLESVALCRWWAYEANRRKINPNVLIHIPNEGKRLRKNIWRGSKLTG